jgi:pimeloyl-ACP methyl ester carboxylesterase
MEIVLIPGFWLGGFTWEEVAAPLRDAGHTVHALTLPGLESVESVRSGIGLGDHVDAVIAAVDALTGPVVLVGHSGGGPIAQAVADSRPERVVRVVYVDSLPLAPGHSINTELTVVDGEIPLPDWAEFDEEDLIDLDADLRSMFRRIAVPEPAGVARNQQTLTSDRRYEVPVTVIACEFSADRLRGWIADGEDFVSELARIANVEIVDLPTGHWPQFTRPRELASAILASIGS